MNDANREQLITAARLLRPLLGELVFVGGTVTGLLITDEAAADPRTTFDVNAIAEITSYAEYAEFGDRLRALGFQEDTREGAPLCRWVHHGTTLDVMPLDEKILGFSNRWYRAAMRSSLTLPMAGARGFTLQHRRPPTAEGLHRLHARLTSRRIPPRGFSNLRSECSGQH